MHRRHLVRLVIVMIATLALGAQVGFAGAQVGVFATDAELDGANSLWDVDLNGDGCLDDNDQEEGFTVDEAELLAPEKSDAYDEAFLTYVDGILYSPSSFDTDDATFADGDPVDIDGLTVEAKYQTFPTANDVLRHLASFTNPSTNDVDVVVSWISDLGSDDNTVVEGTSSGDDTFAASDSWVVTSDGGPSDPVVSFAFFGEANPASSWVPVQPFGLTPGVCQEDSINVGDDEVAVDFALTIPAGSTCSLLFFGGLSETVGGALDLAPTLTVPGSTLLSGLSDDELASVINYNLVESSACYGDAPVPPGPPAVDPVDPVAPVRVAPAFTG